MRSVWLISAGALALAASPATARNGAWYVGGDFGAMIVEGVDFDYGLTPNLPGHDDAQVVVDHDYGFDGSLFVGYDLGTFRLEAEVAYKRASLDEFETSIFLPSTSGPHPPGTHDAFGNTSTLSFMVNGMLDFGDEDGISGFVGGGAGVARVDYSNLRAFANTGAFIDDSDTRFAWQLLAGVRAAISDNIDITVRYRFFNVDSIRTVDVSRTLDAESRIRSHSLLGGITFNFGAPPPPPPPAPEVQTTVPQPQLPPAETFPPQQPQPQQQEPVKGENG
jgi:opacity protein-like surface antigen